jgi:hypothetical protein
MKEVTVEEQDALNKLQGLKLYKVYASELVYYAKTVLATDKDDAQKVAIDEGFDGVEVFDSTDFEIYEVSKEE